MRKTFAYLAGMGLILSSFFLAQSCSKTDDGSDDILGNWIRSSDFDGNARSEAVVFNIGENVYLCTGTTDRDRFKDLWEYNLDRRYWSQKADLPGVARNSAIAFAINGKGYVGTGYDGVNRLNDFWEYDPALNQWTAKRSFQGTARYDASAFTLNDKGYIACGFDGNYLKDLWQYDPLTDSWIQKASIDGTKRSAAVSFVINNKAYICSGNNNGSALNDLWVYDDQTNTWTEKRKITSVSDDDYDDDYTNIPRINGTAFTIGNYAYLATGENSALITNTWEYNPADDTWLQRTAFEGSARTGAVAFTLNNRGFVLTGRSGSLSFDNAYELKPTAEQDDDDN